MAANTRFHITGTSLAGGDYFPYTQPLVADRKSLGAGRGALMTLTRAADSQRLILAAFDEKILEAEQKRDLFSRVAPGWAAQDEYVRELGRARSTKLRKLEEVQRELVEAQNSDRMPHTSQLYWAAAQCDFRRRNYARDVVDVRKVNYFVQDNQGQFHTNAYLPDVEPNSPRRPTFLAPHPARAKLADGPAGFGLWGPNPTFHRAVRKSTGHWFGAGALTFDSHAAYLDRKKSELLEPRAASFLLRRRPDVGGATLWSALEEADKHRASSQRPESESVQAMLTARRGYIPISRHMQSRESSRPHSRRLDPELLPSGLPGAVDKMVSPRLERARAMEALGSPYAVDPEDMLGSPRHTQNLELNLLQKEGHDSDDVVSPHPARKKRYFHEEPRGKVYAKSIRKPETDTANRPQKQSNEIIDWKTGGESNYLRVEGLEQEQRQLEQEATLREMHARELKRRALVLPAWDSVQRMAPTFVSRKQIGRPDVQLKVRNQ